ncbi:MAG: type II secretion system GspH family protein [Fusobacteriaceae bacterium]|nr:type II secretion system GspH family protein [Fusobacteriaceae bacterium]
MHFEKNSGMTLIEVMTVIGLMGILIMLIHPTLYTFYKSRITFGKINSYDLKNARLIDIIEEAINNSFKGEESFSGKEYLKNGKGIYIVDKTAIKILDDDFFKNNEKSGNFLFLEMPIMKNKIITNRYLAFKIIGGNLSMIQYSISENKIKQTREEVILDNITGNFSIDENVIKILLIHKEFDTEKYIEGIGEIGRNYE